MLCYSYMGKVADMLTPATVLLFHSTHTARSLHEAVFIGCDASPFLSFVAYCTRTFSATAVWKLDGMDTWVHNWH